MKKFNFIFGFFIGFHTSGLCTVAGPGSSEGTGSTAPYSGEYIYIPDRGKDIKL